MSAEVKKYPKLLVICHNILEDTNNIGKTLISLLSGWPKDRLCQIYLRDDIPSFKYCNNYYRIIDKDILKSYFKGRKNVGCVFNSSLNNLTSKKDMSNEQTFYNLGNKRIPIVSLCRDLLWKRKSWRNDRLDKWLEEQKL